MKIGDLSRLKSIFPWSIKPIKVTIEINVTFVKELSEILSAELNKVGIPVEPKSCTTIINKMLDKFLKQRNVQGVKDKS